MFGQLESASRHDHLLRVSRIVAFSTILEFVEVRGIESNHALSNLLRSEGLSPTMPRAVACFRVIRAGSADSAR